MARGASIWRDAAGAIPAGRPAYAGAAVPGSAAARAAARRVAFLAALLAVPILLWVAAVFLVDDARFVIIAPRSLVGEIEMASSFARLFAALVLGLFPDPGARLRLRWLAAGFLVLGLGGLIFGTVYPALTDDTDLNVAMYGAFLARGLAGALFVAGFLPPRPRALGARTLALSLALLAGSSAAIIGLGSDLPPLTRITDLNEAARTAATSLDGLTGLHWLLSSLALLAALLATLGSLRHFPGSAIPGWLVLGMVLWTGSQVHYLFWPSAFSPILTTSNILRLAFSLVVAVGGVLELLRVASERGRSLEVEQQAREELARLAGLKADFTAMVAHELGQPLSAIRLSSEVIATDPLTPHQASALETIRRETHAVNALVADVQAIANIERDRFTVVPREVPVRTLLDEAAAFARTLPGDHPFTCPEAGPERVWADRARIGQVLRNLLGNAAKYSPPGAPIALRATRHGRVVRFEVSDQGFGIDPEEIERVFDKFVRGQAESSRGTKGAGLGLYLSRRIVEEHGGALRVTSAPGAGSVFTFDLEVCE